MLTVGRLQKRKGHDNLIRALCQIRRSVPDVLYAIVGDGAERSELEDLVRQLDLGAHVQFRGDIDDGEMIQCYQQCDLFVLPNREVQGDIEGFGIVLVEAQACGKPVIAGVSGGTSDTMQLDVTGQIVPAESVAELAESATALLKDGQRRDKMGQAARTWAVENFDWEILARRARTVLQDGGSRVMGATCVLMFPRWIASEESEMERSVRPKNGKFLALDVLRVVAMAAIVYQHILPMYGRPLNVDRFPNVGQLGVTVFCGISGFFAFRGGTVDSRDWIWKRLIRIFPPYWVALTGVFALNAVSGYKPVTMRVVGLEYAGLAAVLDGDTRIGQPFWFITLILICYAFAAVFRSRPKFLPIGIVCVASCCDPVPGFGFQPTSYHFCCVDGLPHRVSRSDPPYCS